MGLIILRNYENDFFENDAKTEEENDFYDPSIFKQSHLGLSNGFYIGINENGFYMNNIDNWLFGDQFVSFTGIMLENISLEFSTPWSEAGGAQIGKKIAGYANSKFIKMLAGQSDEGFQPFICSDAWTQQKVGGDASPLKISLKFRSFPNQIYGMSTYEDVIKFLITICSPMKSASYQNVDTKTYKDQYGTEGVGTQAKNNIVNAAKGGANILNNVKDAGSTFSSLMKKQEDKDKESNARKNFTDAARALVDTAEDVYKKIVTNTSDGRNNANFTVNFRLGKPNTIASKINNRTIGGGNNIDWIITSFNFKPSMQFYFNETAGKPYPLWVDFDLSMETRLSLSNKYIHNLIMDTEF
jgi:hypothetical protein